MIHCLGMGDRLKEGSKIQQCADKEGESVLVVPEKSHAINNIRISVKYNPNIEDSRPQPLPTRNKQIKAHEMDSNTFEEWGKSLPSLNLKYENMKGHPETAPQRMRGPYAKLSKWSVTARRGKTPALPSYACISADEQFEKTYLNGEEDLNSGMDSSEIDYKVVEDFGMTFISGSSKMYQCRICKRCFDTRQALGGHTASHSGKKNSGQKSTMLAEMNTVNKMVVVDHKCNFCGTTFLSGKALGGHKRHHLRDPNQNISMLAKGFI